MARILCICNARRPLDTQMHRETAQAYVSLHLRAGKNLASFRKSFFRFFSFAVQSDTREHSTLTHLNGRTVAYQR